jgi:IclR family transcriptional regulator, pca regulon regulatory protein
LTRLVLGPNVRVENRGAHHEHSSAAATRADLVGTIARSSGDGARDVSKLASVDEARDTDFVQSLQRGLAVIRAFDAEHPALTLSEVARRTGLPRAAARRFLLTLVELGYMRVDQRRFRLTPRVLELGHAYLSSLTLPDVALPHMREFVTEVRESSSLAVLDEHQIVYVARMPANRIMSVSISVGTRFPAFATSLGRVLLAARTEEWLDAYLATADLRPWTARGISDPLSLRVELARVRRQGWAMVDQELEEGVRSLATPIHDAAGHVVAGLNVSVHASRWTLDAVREQLLPRLVDTARRIDADARATADF